MPVARRLQRTVIDVQARVVLDAELQARVTDLAVQESDAVVMVYTPHPVTLLGQTRTLHAAQVTLEQLADAAGVLGAARARHVMCIGGVPVPAAQWGLVKVKGGQLVELRSVAKELFSAGYAFLSYIYYAVVMYTGYIALAYLAVALVVVAGLYLINKLLAPPKRNMLNKSEQSSAAKAYMISGSSNSVRPYEMVPFVLGQIRVTPDYGGLPYTQFQGADQYFYGVFNVGVNCAYYVNPMIGNTNLAVYSDVTQQSRGFADYPDQQLTLWTNVDVLAGGTLLAPAASVPVVRTSSNNAACLGIDIDATVFGINADGSFSNDQWLGLHAEFRAVGATTWIPYFDNSNSAQYFTNLTNTPNFAPFIAGWPYAIKIYNASTKPMRLSFYRQVSGLQYEVRVFKVSLDVDKPQQQNQAALTSLQTYQYDPGNYAGQGMIGLRIKSSGQLNGALDQFSVHVISRRVPVWDGSAWINQATSNAGALLLQFIRGIRDGAGALLAGYGLADSRIDIESFKPFILHCAARGLTFNKHFTELQSCDEVAELIARCGMGSISYHTGKLGVIFFASTQPIEGVVNMANIKLGTFSVDYYTGTTADELQVSFADGVGFSTALKAKTLRVRSPVSTTFNNIGRMTLDGVTNEPHAAMMGRFAMGQNVYQRKSVQFEMDLEYLTFHRGSVIALSHDMTQWGYGGRLRSAVNNAGVVTLELDDLVPATNPAGSSVMRMVGLRLLGEAAYRTFAVQTFTGTTRTVVLQGTWPAGVALPGSVAGEGASECIWIYDFKATPGLRSRVTAVEPLRNLQGAKITVVPEPDAFWPYVYSGAYLPPANNSLLDRKPPVATRPAVTEELKRQGAGFFTELTLTCDVAGNFDFAEVWGARQSNLLFKMGQTRTTQFTFAAAVDDVWTLQFRPYDALGRVGTIAAITYTVVGLRAPPSDVVGFSLSIGNTGVNALWTQNVDVDRAFTWLRKGATWAAATPLNADGTEVKTDTTNWQLGWLPAGVTTIVAKHSDTTDNLSLLEASAAITVLAPNAPVFVDVRVELNKVNFQWADAKTSQPILKYGYRIAKITGGSQGPWLDRGGAGSDSRSDNIPFFDAGSWCLEITATDVAGNVGVPNSTIVSISLPDDFRPLLSTVDNFSGVMVNSAKTGLFNRVTLPLNSTETRDQHFTSRGWASRAAAVAAGYPLRYQPGVATSSYTKDTDIGAVFTAGTITWQLSINTLTGSPQYTQQIGYKRLIGDAWTFGSVGSTSLLASNFRYVRQILTVNSPQGANIASGFGLAEIELSQLNIGVQTISETVTLACLASDVNGTPYTTTRGFTSVSSVTFGGQPVGSLIARPEHRIVDVGAPGTPAQVFIYLFNAASQRISGNQFITIDGV